MIQFSKIKRSARVDVSAYDCPQSVIPSLLKLKSEYTYTSKEGTATFYSNEDCDDYADVVATVWGLLLPYRRCQGPIRATLLLGDSEKRLAGVLGEDNVNTGYARKCTELVVYRKEEWVKVFIHECMHEMGLDKGMTKVRLPMFRLSHEVALYEAYCEVWARILNCYLVASYTGQAVAALLERERKYSVYNMVKVLAHSGLAYADLWSARAASYAENTNVIAYVVLGAILMSDYQAFRKEFEGFRGTDAGMLALLHRQYKSPLLLREIRLLDSKGTGTSRMRMSIVDLF
jgi:hypothetical protein